MTNNNEQWILEGNCNLCRRKNYCKTRCSKSKKYEQNEIDNIVANTLFKGFSQEVIDLMKIYK